MELHLVLENVSSTLVASLPDPIGGGYHCADQHYRIHLASTS